MLVGGRASVEVSSKAAGAAGGEFPVVVGSLLDTSTPTVGRVALAFEVGWYT